MQPRFSEEHVKEKYLLTAFLTLPVEEEVSISRQNTVHTTSTMSENQAIFKKKNATATQLMHELRYIDTYRLSCDKHLSNAIVRAMSGNTSVKKVSINKDVCWSEPLRIIARTLCI